MGTEEIDSETSSVDPPENSLLNENSTAQVHYVFDCEGEEDCQRKGKGGKTNKQKKKKGKTGKKNKKNKLDKKGKNKNNKGKKDKKGKKGKKGKKNKKGKNTQEAIIFCPHTTIVDECDIECIGKPYCTENADPGFHYSEQIGNWTWNTTWDVGAGWLTAECTWLCQDPPPAVAMYNITTRCGFTDGDAK